MIKAKLEKKEFIVDDEDIICKDKSIKNFVKNIYDMVLIGFKPSDGNPELILIEDLKKVGAKDIEYYDDNKNLIY